MPIGRHLKLIFPFFVIIFFRIHLYKTDLGIQTITSSESERKMA